MIRLVRLSASFVRPVVVKRQERVFYDVIKCYSSTRIVSLAIPEIEITHTSSTKVKKEEVYTSNNAFDAERDDLFPLRRAIAFHYDNGNYQLALKLATELKDKVATIYGTKTTVYASSLSNIALMVMNKFIFARSFNFHLYSIKC